MRISQVIAELAKIMAEAGDLPAMATEWAGARNQPVTTVEYRDLDEYGRERDFVYIGASGEGESDDTHQQTTD